MDLWKGSSRAGRYEGWPKRLFFSIKLCKLMMVGHGFGKRNARVIKWWDIKPNIKLGFSLLYHSYSFLKGGQFSVFLRSHCFLAANLKPGVFVASTMLFNRILTNHLQLLYGHNLLKEKLWKIQAGGLSFIYVSKINDLEMTKLGAIQKLMSLRERSAFSFLMALIDMQKLSLMTHLYFEKHNNKLMLKTPTLPTELPR